MKNCRRFISVLLTAVLLCSQLSISALAEGTEAAAHSYDANGFCTDAGCTAYDEAWFYVQNGKLDTTYNGYVDYNGGKFLVAEGRIVREAKGLVQDPNNAADWYYLADGQVVSYTGLTLYDEEWFYVENGKLASDYTGNVDYNGSTFYVVNGMLAENN